MSIQDPWSVVADREIRKLERKIDTLQHNYDVVEAERNRFHKELIVQGVIITKLKEKLHENQRVAKK